MPNYDDFYLDYWAVPGQGFPALSLVISPHYLSLLSNTSFHWHNFSNVCTDKFEILEFIIFQINRLLLEDDTALENHNSEYQLIIREFRAFLSDCKDVLDEATTMKLLER